MQRIMKRPTKCGKMVPVRPHFRSQLAPSVCRLKSSGSRSNAELGETLLSPLSKPRTIRPRTSTHALGQKYSMGAMSAALMLMHNRCCREHNNAAGDDTTASAPSVVLGHRHQRLGTIRSAQDNHTCSQLWGLGAISARGAQSFALGQCKTWNLFEPRSQSVALERFFAIMLDARDAKLCRTRNEMNAEANRGISAAGGM